MTFPLTIILENIRSAYNVGSIFRTSDGAGIEKLILTGYTPYPPHNRIPKTALGAIDNVNWERVEDILKVIEDLKGKDYEIISVELDERAIEYTKVEYKKPTALIFGNEVDGVSKAVMEKSDKIVYIPMFGTKNSLNVSVAFGISVYEVVKQWR